MSFFALLYTVSLAFASSTQIPCRDLLYKGSARSHDRAELIDHLRGIRGVQPVFRSDDPTRDLIVVVGAEDDVNDVSMEMILGRDITTHGPTLLLDRLIGDRWFDYDPPGYPVTDEKTRGYIAQYNERPACAPEHVEAALVILKPGRTARGFWSASNAYLVSNDGSGCRIDRRDRAVILGLRPSKQSAAAWAAAPLELLSRDEPDDGDFGLRAEALNRVAAIYVVTSKR